MCDCTIEADQNWIRLSQKRRISLINKSTVLFMVILIGLLSACNSASNDHVDKIEPILTNDEEKADFEGIVLEANEHGITLARNLTLDEYDEIKNESVTKLQNEDVMGERESLGLIELTYGNKDEFNPGDLIEVWIDGDIMELYPERAIAKRIVVKD